MRGLNGSDQRVEKKIDERRRAPLLTNSIVTGLQHWMETLVRISTRVKKAATAQWRPVHLEHGERRRCR